MNSPCDNCPFLKVGGVRLTMARVQEIAGGALMSQGRTFQCHKTLKRGQKEAHCGGALIFAEKNGNATQMMRIAERLGMYDADALKAQDTVFDTLEDMLKTAIDYEEGTGEPCSVADDGCNAPAGYMTGGEAIVQSGASAKYECYGCSNSVCGSCSQPHPKKRGKRLCNYCLEVE